MEFNRVKRFVKTRKLPLYRIAQIRKAVYEQGVSSWEEATVLPAALRAELAVALPILSFKPQTLLRSRRDPVSKALLALGDGALIETVLLRPFAGHWSVCVSSQAGCPVRCKFCATGKNGFVRNLTAEEISDQVLFWHQQIKKDSPGERVSSVVFMGMGEPFLNYFPVLNAIKNISDADYLNIGQRHISVSTAGHADGILALARDLPQANLAVSLHSGEDELRGQLIPLNNVYNLESLRNAIEEYLEKTKRQVFIEYTLIPSVNDSARDARFLIKWIKEFKQTYLLHVNIIGCNPCAGFAAPHPDAAAEFSSWLLAAGVKSSVRKSLGPDIEAGCGQLAGRARGRRPASG